jgi:hypothetical protein
MINNAENSDLEHEKDHPRKRLCTREQVVLDASTWKRDILCNNCPTSVRNKL